MEPSLLFCASAPGNATITVSSTATSQDRAKTAKIKIYVVPVAISSLKVSNTAIGVKVTWNKVSGATGYDLYCDGYLVLSNKNVVSYTGYAANGSTYTYKVFARCSGGISTKLKSVTQTFLKQPEITELTSRKSGRIGCWWSKNSESSGSEMQYSTRKDFKSDVKTVDVPKTDTRNYVVNGLPSGKTYYVYSDVVGQAFYFRPDNGRMVFGQMSMLQCRCMHHEPESII